MALIAKSVCAAALLYLALVAVLALFQHSLVFPRHMVGPAPALPATTRRLTLATSDNQVLHGVHIPGTGRNTGTILGFPGNAWNAEAMALFLHQIAPTQDVVVYHYRGYAPSTGRPSARALLDDALHMRDTLQGPVTLVGFSIGTGIASQVASARDSGRVILVTPFDSLAKVAADSLPFLPVSVLFRHEMNAAAALQDTQAQVTLIVADRDEVIAPARAKALIASLPDARVVTLEAGHNDIYNAPDFVPAMRRALR